MIHTKGIVYINRIGCNPFKYAMPYRLLPQGLLP